jgi:hypothetical protein
MAILVKKLGARKFGEAIFGDDKLSKEVTHLDNTGWLKKR